MQVTTGLLVGGKYRLERPLARGGMGTVWVARHATLGSPVAIKFLDAHLAAAPSVVARFEREARAAANLDTPHVVHVYDHGVEDGTPYLVMELLRGEDLDARLKKTRRLALPEAGKILVQMGRALRRAHDAGIVHRDLKPANVFLACVEDEEVVKILDFGIAKETWSRVDEATKTGEIFGSPHYMSPEQARGQKTIDLRADIWAVGVILFRAATGRLPFPGEVLGEVLSSVLVDPVPSMAEVAPDLPPALDGFFARTLAKKKEERFSSIGELIEAFSRIAEAHPVIPVQVSIPVARPSAPTLEPRMEASGVVDTTAPTQVLVQPEAATQHLSAPPLLASAPASSTGPSLVTSTSSVAPPLVAARRPRALLFTGLAIGAVALTAVGLLVARGSGDPAAGSSREAASVPLPLPPSFTTQPISTAPVAAPLSAEPSSTLAPIPSAEPLSSPREAEQPAPSATSAASVLPTSRAAVAIVAGSQKVVAPSAATGAQKTAAPPVVTAPPRKIGDTEWGLPGSSVPNETPSMSAQKGKP